MLHLRDMGKVGHNGESREPQHPVKTSLIRLLGSSPLSAQAISMLGARPDTQA